jgi:hypothetical protein
MIYFLLKKTLKMFSIAKIFFHYTKCKKFNSKKKFQAKRFELATSWGHRVCTLPLHR